MTDGEIAARRIAKLFDLRPAAIVKKFGLKTRSSKRRHPTDISATAPHPQGEVWEDGREVEREIEILRLGKARCRRSDQAKFGLLTRPTAQVKVPEKGTFVCLHP